MIIPTLSKKNVTEMISISHNCVHTLIYRIYNSILLISLNKNCIPVIKIKITKKYTPCK